MDNLVFRGARRATVLAGILVALAVAPGCTLSNLRHWYANPCRCCHSHRRAHPGGDPGAHRRAHPGAHPDARGARHRNSERDR